MHKETRVPKLLTKKEAANRLTISTRTLDRFRRLGLLQAVKVRNVVRFRESDLDDFLSRHRR
jgi:excisionase family DNA binding protein